MLVGMAERRDGEFSIPRSCISQKNGDDNGGILQFVPTRLGSFFPWSEVGCEGGGISFYRLGHKIQSSLSRWCGVQAAVPLAKVRFCGTESANKGRRNIAFRFRRIRAYSLRSLQSLRRGGGW